MKILFSVLLGAVIIRIVGENKENKVHEYVPVNWILSVQAELGTQGSSLPRLVITVVFAWNNFPSKTAHQQRRESVTRGIE